MWVLPVRAAAHHVMIRSIMILYPLPRLGLQDYGVTARVQVDAGDTGGAGKSKLQ